jgi:hypothetical protein
MTTQFWAPLSTQLWTGISTQFWAPLSIQFWTGMSTHFWAPIYPFLSSIVYTDLNSSFYPVMNWDVSQLERLPTSELHSLPSSEQEYLPSSEKDIIPVRRRREQTCWSRGHLWKLFFYVCVFLVKNIPRMWLKLLVGIYTRIQICVANFYLRSGAVELIQQNFTFLGTGLTAHFVTLVCSYCVAISYLRATL